MKQPTHPNFIIGIISLFLLFAGVFMRINAHRGGDYVLIATMIIGGIHWIWAIIDVFKHQHIASQSRVLWGILVIVVPPVGGLLYYAMSKTVRM